MLRIIRKGVDTIFIRIILGLIAISFVGFGGVSLMSGNSMGNAISFKDAPNISIEEFQRAKLKTIDAIQKGSGVNLTEDQIKALEIDRIVVRDFVTKSMLDYLGKKYDLDVSDEYLINQVKNYSIFHNESGKFDLSIFKATMRNSGVEEGEYLENVKTKLTQDGLLNIFSTSFPIPKMISENLINFMAETKVVNIYQSNLLCPASDFKIQDPSDDIITGIYNSNPEIFRIPEMRSFKLLKFSKDQIDRRLNLTEEDFQRFFEDNPEEFAEKTYDEASAQVKESLINIKRDDAMAGLMKDLEQDISSGININEMSKKYGIVAEDLESKSKESLILERSEYSDIYDQLFAMVDGEVSYPLENKDQNELYVFELVQITPSRIQSIAEARNSIITSWKQAKLKEHNLNNFLQFKEQYSDLLKTGKEVTLKKKQIADRAFLQSRCIELYSDIQINREESLSNQSYPAELLHSIFATDSGDSTRVITNGDKSVFAFVKRGYIDPKKAKAIQSDRYDSYAATIRAGILGEIISYLVEKNETTITLRESL